MSLPSYLEPLSEGLYAVDTGFHRPRFDAAYLMVDGGRAAFIDTGTNHAVPRLLGALEALGLPRTAVEWVIPTHVHLDHAGGCGALMQELPAARTLVHPRGARHLIDPSALYEGALAVYGQAEMDRSYGRLVGIPAERVVTSTEGMLISLGQRPLELIDTPGHARHHHCIWDAQTQGWFTGDTFGLSYREFDLDGKAWILPTSTPVQFEPDVLKTTIARLMTRKPRVMYLTHYSAVSEVARLAKELVQSLDEMVATALDAPVGAPRHAWLKQRFQLLYTRSLRRHGHLMSDSEIAQALAVDIELNAQGVAVWLDKQARAVTEAAQP